MIVMGNVRNKRQVGVFRGFLETYVKVHPEQSRSEIYDGVRKVFPDRTSDDAKYHLDTLVRLGRLQRVGKKYYPHDAKVQRDSVARE